MTPAEMIRQRTSFRQFTGKGVAGYMNRIDIGIALAHLHVANEDTFRFFRAKVPTMPGYDYIGSISIGE